MTLADIDPTIREFLFAREALRRLGFAADDLYFVVQTNGRTVCAETGIAVDHGKPLVGLQLRAQGLEWTWICGVTDLPKTRIVPEFEKAVKIWNTPGDEDARHALWEQSVAFRDKVLLVKALQAYGFRFNIPEEN